MTVNKDFKQRQDKVKRALAEFDDTNDIESKNRLMLTTEIDSLMKNKGLQLPKNTSKPIFTMTPLF